MIVAPKVEILPLYSIELNLEISPRLGVKCGAICVFGENDVDVGNLTKDLRPEAVRELQQHVNESAQALQLSPEFFNEREGRWLPWAFDRMLCHFDRVGTNASFGVNSARLGILARIPRSDILERRSRPAELFKIALDIDRLLSLKYQFDPWSGNIRRGILGPKVGR